MQISIDGFVASETGKMDWLIWDWDDELKKYVTEITEPVETILLGRKLAEGFIPAWESMLAQPVPAEGAEKMVHTPKVVFTKTLDSSPWSNAVLAKGDLVEEIEKLKSQEGGDIIAYGGGSFVSSLITAGLIDEYNLFVNPTGLGTGMSIFQQRTDLKSVSSTAFPCGVIALRYVPK